MCLDTKAGRETMEFLKPAAKGSLQPWEGGSIKSGCAKTGFVKMVLGCLLTNRGMRAMMLSGLALRKEVELDLSVIAGI